jgi:hypothetical protein
MDSNYQQQAEHEQQQWLVYQKLQNARVKLQSMSLKKSGHNKFADFKYFELADFLPSVNTIFAELGLCSVFSINRMLNGDEAVLRIVDFETGGSIHFRSPTAEAVSRVTIESGKSPAIQALGSQHTYLRRYLMLNALEITEHDAVDATIGKDAPKASKAVTVDVYDSMTQEDQEFIENIAVEVRWMIEKGDVDGAVQYINDQQLDADFKTALWSRFDSKQRSALKKASVK